MTDRVARVAAVVLAGGAGTRLGASQNKVYLDLVGRPMLSWSLATLDAHPEVGTVVVAVRPGDEATFHEQNRRWPIDTPVHTVIGGASRSASEAAAFDLLRPTVEAGGLDVVLVHDGARPFLTVEMVDRVIDAARRHGAAIPGLEPARPLYQLDPDGSTATRLSGEILRTVQTPQGFHAAPLLRSYSLAADSGFEGVDTAEVVAHHAGIEALVVAGDADNIKVTTPADLIAAREIAALRTP